MLFTFLPKNRLKGEPWGENLLKTRHAVHLFAQKSDKRGTAIEKSQYLSNSVCLFDEKAGKRHTDAHEIPIFIKPDMPFR